MAGLRNTQELKMYFSSLKYALVSAICEIRGLNGDSVLNIKYDSMLLELKLTLLTSIFPFMLAGKLVEDHCQTILKSYLGLIQSISRSLRKYI